MRPPRLTPFAFPLWTERARDRVSSESFEDRVRAVMQVLKNMINLVTWIPTHIEFAVVGAVILFAVIADELVKRAVARQRLKA